MPVTHKKVAGWRSDAPTGEGTSRVPPTRAVQPEDVGETSLHSSPAPSSHQEAPGPTGPPETPPAPPMPTDQEFRSAVYMLAQLTATQRQPVATDVAGPSEGPGSSRVREFLALNPPQYAGTDRREDPQHFID